MRFHSRFQFLQLSRELCDLALRLGTLALSLDLLDLHVYALARVAAWEQIGLCVADSLERCTRAFHSLAERCAQAAMDKVDPGKPVRDCSDGLDSALRTRDKVVLTVLDVILLLLAPVEEFLAEALGVAPDGLVVEPDALLRSDDHLELLDLVCDRVAVGVSARIRDETADRLL